MQLTAEEIRVLGSLVEKEATTPDQYPLSTNALTNACNQKSSRDPVVSYDQRLVSETMLLLRPAGLARTIVSGRTEKHRHVLDEALGLERSELAVMAVLMLRGPQAPGELRTRTERSYGFDSIEEVEATLAALAAKAEPLTRNLGRGPGQSQDRWIHLLEGPAGAVSASAVSASAVPTSAVPTSAVPTSAVPTSAVPTNAAPPAAVVAPRDLATPVDDERSSSLERRVDELERRMAALESELGL